MDGRSRESHEGSRRFGPAALCAVAACVAALLYAPTVGFDFAYDDTSVVLRHPQVLGQAWGAIATSPYHVGEDVRVQTGAYRPLTIASLAVNHAISGVAPWSYHLTNVLLHAAATALVLLLGVELGLMPGAAFVGALAFAVHPVHVEAVANVAGRAELLSTVLALGALIDSARGRLVASAVLLLGALFAKENAVTILGVIALSQAVRTPRVRRTAMALAAAAVPIALYLAARLAVLGRLGLMPGSVTSIENPVFGLSPLPHAATVLAVFGRAVSLVVTPIRLSPDYGFAEITPSPTLAAPGPMVGIALLAIVIASIVFCWRRAPRVTLLVGATLVTYSIVSNAFVVIGTVLGDRLLYLPSVFACLLLGLAATAAARRFGGSMVAIGTGVLVVLLAARSAAYAAVWREDATLFAYAARVTPQSVKALGGWAGVLAEQGRIDDAREVLDRAVAIAPDFIPNLLNRASTALTSGDLDAAEADARHVLALDPGNSLAQAQVAAIATRR